MLHGTVSEFSFDRGLGTITDPDGQSYLFHVVEIADGTRTIGVGQTVTFDPLPKFGAIEASNIRNTED